jgi:autotransporter-associated beta strand protein
MKTPRISGLIRSHLTRWFFGCSAAIFIGYPTIVNAATLTWDTASGDSTTITAGSGTWDLTAGNTVWNDAGTNTIWSHTSTTDGSNAAVFAGTDGAANQYTVTLGAQMATESVTFNSSGYRITGSTLAVMPTASTSGTITVAANKTATINSILRYNHNTGANVTVSSGGTLNLGGGTTASNNPQFNFSGAGTINLTGGTFTSNIATFGNAVINVTGGTHAITPGTNVGAEIRSNAQNVAYNLNGGTLTVNGNATTQTNSLLGIGGATGTAFTSTLNVISGTMNVGTTASTAGEIRISGTNAASNGTLNVSGGTVTVGTGKTDNKIYFFKSGADAGYTANMTQSGGTVTANGIQFGGTSGTYNASSAANLTLSGGSLYVGLQGITSGSAASSLPVAIKLQGGTIGASDTWSSSLSMKLGATGGGPVFQAATSDGTSKNITLSGILSDDTSVNGRLTKTGAGTLTLTGSNTFSGGLNIKNGTVDARLSDGVLGSGTITMGGVGSTGATLAIGRTFANNFTINAPDNGTVLIAANGDGSKYTLTGGINLNGNLTLQSFDTPTSSSGTASGTIKGGITGTGNLVLNNLGRPVNTLTLDTGAINHAGSITNVSSGTAPSGDTTISAPIGSNVTGITQSSTTSRLVLSGSNTFTGATTINAGTLALGASDVLPNATTVSIGTATLNVATFTDTAGTLAVTAATSTVNLGVGAALAFADSSAVNWSGGTLNITGTFVSGTSLRFGTTSGGLTSTQLSQITATGISNFALNESGYLIEALPEIAIEEPAGSNIAHNDSKDFGMVGLGLNKSLTFTIRNSGDLSLSLLATPPVAISGDNADDFTVTTQPDATIAAKGTTTFTVRFAPSAVVGPRSAKLSIANNDNDKNPFEINLSGTGILPPEIVVEQAGAIIANSDLQDFGTVQIGLSNSLTFTIRNTGEADLNLTGTPRVASSGTHKDEFTVTAQPGASIAGAASTTFTVQFAPTAVGSRSAALTIANNDSDEDSFVINLSGTAVLPPEIAIEEPVGTNIASNDSKDFGRVGLGLEKSLTFTVRNTGLGDLFLTSLPRVAIGGINAAEFTVTAEPSATVAAAGTTTFTVKFVPSESGPRSAQISIANNDSNKNPFVINLSGTGLGPQEIAVEEPAGTDIPINGSRDFGSVVIETSKPLTFTIRNNGDLPLNLSGTSQVVISGTNAADFTVTTQPAATIAANGATTFTVSFAPSTVAGPRSAKLSIANDDSNENPFEINLSGTGILPPEIAVEQPVGTNIATSGTQAFGNVGLGLTNSLTFTIRNSGDLPLSLSGTTRVAISGTNADDFTVTTQPDATIAANGTTTFTVRFAPSVSVGARSAQLSITNNDSDENPFVINLSGTAVLPPEIAVEQPVGANIATSGTQAFGDVGLGLTNSLTFTIRNSGDLPLSLSGTPRVAISGANADDFTATTQPDATIAAKGTTTFTVRFAPSVSVGARSAQLSITNNDSDESPFVINLSGVAILPPEIAVEEPANTGLASGGSRDFGTTGIGFSKNLTFTIRNTGEADLNLTGTPRVAISGTHKDEFTVTSQPNASVLGAGTTTFTVQFAPTAVGIRSAALTIANNDSDEGSYVINLTGTSVLPPDIAVEQPAGTPIVSGLLSTKDFGTVAYGSSKNLTFTLRNTGLGGLSLTNLPRVVVGGTDSNDFLVIASPASYVAPGGSTTFTVQFNPRAAGARNATLTIPNNDFGDESPYEFNLTGTGSGGPQIAVEQPATNVILTGGTRDFGTVMRDSSKSLTFTVRNGGTGYLYLTGTPRVKVGGDDPANFIVSASPATSVAGGSSTPFTVQFVPSAKRLYQATLTIDTDANGSHVINLTGTGDGDPEMAIEQAGNDIADDGAQDFGTVATSSSKSLTFTIRNTGKIGLNLIRNPGESLVNISGYDKDSFLVTASPATTIPAGGSTNFTVQFTPSSNAPHSASLSISNNDGDENPFVIGLSGNPAAEIAVEQPAGTDISHNGSRGFGSADIGSPTSLTFTIRNSGGIGMNLTGSPLVAISGTNASDFTVTAPPVAVVAAAGSTTFTVQFAPSALGTRNAQLSIANDDSNENPFVINLSGTGTGASEIAVEQVVDTEIANNGSQDFGPVLLGLDGDLTFTIRNKGDRPLNLTGTPRVAISGTNASDFEVTSEPSASVAAAGSTTFTVSFAPSAVVGARSAQLSIANNDSNENPYVINLSGTAVDQLQYGLDHAGNYPGGTWTNGSNGGTGFGAWTIASNNNNASRFAGNFVGNPTAAGITGMSSTSFGLYANPLGSGAFVNAERNFANPLGVGDSFSFQWGINWDSNGGNKGFSLYSGATELINVNNGSNADITIKGIDVTGTNVGFGYGAAAMTWTITRTTETNLQVDATDRDGVGAYSGNFTISETAAPDSFKFYASGMDIGDNRQPYFNNLQLTKFATIAEPLVLASPINPLDDYMTSFGLTGNDALGTADPDGDGQSNDAEFAFGTDPSNGWSQQTSLVNEPGIIKLIYLQRDSGVTYTVKSFSDLSTPFDDGVEVTPVASDPQPDGLPEGYTQYEASLSTSSGKGFLRVKAVRE